MYWVGAEKRASAKAHPVSLCPGHVEPCLWDPGTGASPLNMNCCDRVQEQLDQLTADEVADVAVLAVGFGAHYYLINGSDAMMRSVIMSWSLSA